MKHSVTLIPESGFAHLYLSKSQLAQKDPKAAQESYNRAIKLDKELRDTGYWIDIQDAICEPLIKAGEYDKAIALYENVLKELEDIRDNTFWVKYYRPRIRVSMAEVYHKARKLDKAIEIYEEVLRKKEKEKRGFGFFESQDSHVYRDLGKIYREKGDEQKALFNEQKADKIEKRSKMFFSMISCGFFTIILGVAQFLLIVAACLYIGIRILILKKGKGISGAPPKKVSWNFRDVLGIYAKAYFLPLVLIFLVFTIAAVCGFGLSGFFFGSTFVLPLLIAVLSLILYWIISKRRFEAKFSQAYPDIKQEAIDRPASVITLTLWQLLCVGMINILFSIIAYGAIMAMLTTGSL